MKSAASGKQTFWVYATKWHTVRRSLRVALIVGTIFALINYLDDLLTGDLTSRDLVSLIASYAVPFCVATYGAAREAMYHQVNPHDHQ